MIPMAQFASLYLLRESQKVRMQSIHRSTVDEQRMVVEDVNGECQIRAAGSYVLQTIEQMMILKCNTIIATIISDNDHHHMTLPKVH